MGKYTCTRQIEIDAAHRVPDHKSKCFNVHGHRYKIQATLSGDVIDDGRQTGMVMDFAFLKDLMMVVIHEPCDHAMIFYDKDPMYLDLNLYTEGWKFYLMDEVPTAENLAARWYKLLRVAINEYWKEYEPRRLAPSLIKVRVYETPNCWADYPV
ncbi:MAG: 6-carboxytetrahydropterin synthase [Dehalococcoidales bacterium]